MIFMFFVVSVEAFRSVGVVSSSMMYPVLVYSSCGDGVSAPNFVSLETV